jgi:hypothetical protein
MRGLRNHKGIPVMEGPVIRILSRSVGDDPDDFRLTPKDPLFVFDDQFPDLKQGGLRTMVKSSGAGIFPTAKPESVKIPSITCLHHTQELIIQNQKDVDVITGQQLHVRSFPGGESI